MASISWQAHKEKDERLKFLEDKVDKLENLVKTLLERS